MRFVHTFRFKDWNIPPSVCDSYCQEKQGSLPVYRRQQDQVTSVKYTFLRVMQNRSREKREINRQEFTVHLNDRRASVSKLV